MKVWKVFVWLILFIFTLNYVFSATYWTNLPTSCPTTDAVNYSGQSCSPVDICGDSSGTAQCYDTSTMANPPNDVNSNTDQSASYNGGFLLNCYATVDASSPYCDNSGAYWCDRDSTCYDIHRQTQCNNAKWSGDAGDITCQACISPYIVCDGSYTDGDGCEVLPNSTNCAVGSNNNLDGTCTCVCDSGYFDCDSSGAGAGNGCEIQTGSACTTAYGTAGTYSGCTCVGTKSYFQTGTNTLYGTGTDENFLWGTNYSMNGWLLMLFNHVSDKNFAVDNNANLYIPDSNITVGCLKWKDGTSSCTAPTGSGGTSDGNVYSLGIMSKDTNAFLIDLNMNGKNIGKVNDMNTLDLNVGRDLNVFRNLKVWGTLFGNNSILLNFLKINVFDANFGNDLNVGRDLNVFRNTRIGQDLNVVRDANINRNLKVLGDLNVIGDLNVNGNIWVDGNITAKTSLGQVKMIPDQNMLCVGSAPNLTACIKIMDGNALFGFV